MADETERIEEMASTMKAAALDEMFQELVEVGYTIYSIQGEQTPNIWKPHVESPDGWVWEGHARHIPPSEPIDACTWEAVENAYKHLQEKRRIAELEAHNAAMKALLGKE